MRRARRKVFKRGVEHVDVDHAAFGTGLVQRVQYFDVIAQAVGPDGENEQRAEEIGQHAPCGEERHGTHGGKA
ncbi:hypothetical protein D3C72_2451050 [compost metagenome]